MTITTTRGLETIDTCVVEDHPLYRAALIRTLEAAPGFNVAASAGSVEEFLAYREPPGRVVILDLGLPGASGAAAVLAVCGAGHRVLVISAQGRPPDVLGAVAAGARGYLTKDADADEILRAVRTIWADNTYVSPTLASFLLDSARDRYTPVQPALSGREREVLSLLAAGERDQDIAQTLGISVRTVRSHLDRIREKTGRRRRPELTRLAIEEGITAKLARCR
ncbi:MAG TPA: response regulator transcription factor [Rugosimonospora sp.]|nr:response regulator transcription factor [Rugosimonospora sp.]